MANNSNQSQTSLTVLKRQATTQANNHGHDMRGKWEDYRIDGYAAQTCEKCGAEVVIDLNANHVISGDASVTKCQEFYNKAIGGRSND